MFFLKSSILKVNVFSWKRNRERGRYLIWKESWMKRKNDKWQKIYTHQGKVPGRWLFLTLSFCFQSSFFFLIFLPCLLSTFSLCSCRVTTKDGLGDYANIRCQIREVSFLWATSPPVPLPLLFCERDRAHHSQRLCILRTKWMFNNDEKWKSGLLVSPLNPYLQGICQRWGVKPSPSAFFRNCRGK